MWKKEKPSDFLWNLSRSNVIKKIKTQIIKPGSNQNLKSSTKEEPDPFPWFQLLRLSSLCIQFASRSAAILKHNKPQSKYLFLFSLWKWRPFKIQTSRLIAQTGAVKSKVTKHFSFSPSLFGFFFRTCREQQMFHFFIISKSYTCLFSAIVYLIFCEGLWLFAAVIRLFPLRILLLNRSITLGPTPS